MKVKIIKRIWIGVVSILMKLPLTGYCRGKLIQLLGVNIEKLPQERLRVFIGDGVKFDNLYPNLIEIGNWTTVATGCLILTHYIYTNRPAPGYTFVPGRVKIGRACFIGANSVICNSVEIGDNSIVAAGSIVTKSIPSNQIWGGNPAKLIKERKL